MSNEGTKPGKAPKKGAKVGLISGSEGAQISTDAKQSVGGEKLRKHRGSASPQLHSGAQEPKSDWTGTSHSGATEACAPGGSAPSGSSGAE